MPLSAFERIIKDVPKDSMVLDIGCGGLGGENTSNYLIKHFEPKNIRGLNKNGDENVKLFNWKLANPEVNIIQDIYPSEKELGRFDVIVHDTNIEGNLELWSNQGLTRIWENLKENGILITYVMATHYYGDEETKKLIASHMLSWWDSNEVDSRVIKKVFSELPGWNLLGVEQEERRPYIYWVKMQLV